MAKARTLVGLDVHASKVVAAMLDAETGELRFGRTVGETDKTVELCTSLERPVRVAYEAGPTGFGLARALEAAGVDCVVAAPGKIPRAATAAHAPSAARARGPSPTTSRPPARRAAPPTRRSTTPLARSLRGAEARHSSLHGATLPAGRSHRRARTAVVTSAAAGFGSDRVSGRLTRRKRALAATNRAHTNDEGGHRQYHSGDAENGLYRFEHPRRTRRAEQQHDELVADRASDGEPAKDSRADSRAWCACARPSGDDIRRGKRACQQAKSDKDDDIDRAHADDSTEPWVWHYVGWDSDH
jgi:hypothetical protein